MHFDMDYDYILYKLMHINQIYFNINIDIMVIQMITIDNYISINFLDRLSIT